MDDEENESQFIRNDFEGDEFVSDVTGKLTKFENKWRQVKNI